MRKQQKQSNKKQQQCWQLFSIWQMSVGYNNAGGVFAWHTCKHTFTHKFLIAIVNWLKVRSSVEPHSVWKLIGADSPWQHQQVFYQPKQSSRRTVHHLQLSANFHIMQTCSKKDKLTWFFMSDLALYFFSTDTTLSNPDRQAMCRAVSPSCDVIKYI